jgi:hypothetical protein
MGIVFLDLENIPYYVLFEYHHHVYINYIIWRFIQARCNAADEYGETPGVHPSIGASRDDLKEYLLANRQVPCFSECYSPSTRNWLAGRMDLLFPLVKEDEFWGPVFKQLIPNHHLIPLKA